MQTVTGTPPIDELKRCYVQGAVVKTKCPSCGHEMEVDFGDQYLSHPEVGEEDNVGFFCDGCEKEWEARGKVISAVVTIEVHDEKLVEV